MRVLVCGSRSWNDGPRIEEELNKLEDVELVIQGGAKGADQLAKFYAEKNGIAVCTYHANWDHWGKRAGAIRNADMLLYSRPDLVLAFRKGLSKGTDNTIKRATDWGYKVKIVEG